MALTINAERLWNSLMELGKIGGTPKGGLNRIAFSDLDKQARDVFRKWAEDAGCTVSVDAFGNMFARREGRIADAPVVMAGSHLDSQPTGGKFDGVFGVLSALETIRSFNDNGIETDAPIEIVNWTNEEGCIFRPMIGSEVWTGLLAIDEALEMREAREGWSIREGLQRMGYHGDAPMMNDRNIACYIEAHIEQGPVLEEAGEFVGVVDATQGQRWYDLTLTGCEAHAGPTPMTVRKDALMGLSRIALEIDRIARTNAPACGTVGRVDVYPNSPNTIPGRVAFSVDLRHPDADTLSALDKEFRTSTQKIADKMRLDLKLEQRVYILPMAFNKPLADAIETAAIRTGKPWRRMYTGAGHDACNVARFLPTAMIFIPCRDGISHNESEWAEPEHVAAGAQVLADTVLAAANGHVNFGGA